MRKNGCITIGNTDMYYVSLGSGEKKLVVLPGLSDGLATVKGKALILKEEHPEKVISLLIEQQEAVLSDEISEKQEKLEKLRELKNGLKGKKSFSQAFWANHTPTTRKVSCTSCGHKGFCVEVWGGDDK